MTQKTQAVAVMNGSGRLTVYADAVTLVRMCKPLWECIARMHPELSKQLRRSVVNVALNITEGDGRFDGNGRERLKTAMYEAKETRDNLEIAAAARLVETGKVEAARRMADSIAARLYRIVGARQRA